MEFLSKEHLIKEGWIETGNITYWKSNHVIYLLPKSLEVIFDDGENMEQELYNGRLPNHEQWEVLKELLNLS